MSTICFNMHFALLQALICRWKIVASKHILQLSIHLACGDCGVDEFYEGTPHPINIFLWMIFNSQPNTQNTAGFAISFISAKTQKIALIAFLNFHCIRWRIIGGTPFNSANPKPCLISALRRAMEGSAVLSLWPYLFPKRAAFAKEIFQMTLIFCVFLIFQNTLEE